MLVKIKRNTYNIFFDQLSEKWFDKECKPRNHFARNSRSKGIWKVTDVYHGIKKYVAEKEFKIESRYYFYMIHQGLKGKKDKVGEVKFKEEVTTKAIPHLLALKYLGFKLPKGFVEQGNEVDACNKLIEKFEAANSGLLGRPPLNQRRLASFKNHNFHKLIPAQIGKLVFNDIHFLQGTNRPIKIVFYHTNQSIRLPKELKIMQAEWERLLEEKKGKIDLQEYDSYAITSVDYIFNDSEKEVKYYFKTKNASKYNRLAITMSLDTLVPQKKITVREMFFKDFMEDPKKINEEFLSPFFGVNVTIVTSDMMAVLVKKNPIVASSERETLHFSVGLPLKRNRDNPYNIDLKKYILHNLYDMYGVTEKYIEDFQDFSFYGINFTTVHCGFAVYGCLKLTIPYDILEQSFATSALARRYTITPLPLDLEEIKSFILDGRNTPINQYALYGLLKSLSVFREIDFIELANEFKDDVWADFSEKIEEKKIEFGLEELRKL